MITMWCLVWLAATGPTSLSSNIVERFNDETSFRNAASAATRGVVKDFATQERVYECVPYRTGKNS